MFRSLLFAFLLCLGIFSHFNGIVYADDYHDRITSYFGWRIHPVTGQWKFHDGVDFAYESGTPIYALREGVVSYAAEYGGYGNCVIINHADGLHTLYAHCSSLVAYAGQEVAWGQLIAYVGSTGVSTGPHLHLTVWTDADGYLDPLDFLGNMSN